MLLLAFISGTILGILSSITVLGIIFVLFCDIKKILLYVKENFNDFNDFTLRKRDKTLILEPLETEISEDQEKQISLVKQSEEDI